MWIAARLSIQKIEQFIKKFFKIYYHCLKKLNFLPKKSIESLYRKNWNNTDNEILYEKMSVPYFQETAALGGLEMGCDVDQIYERYLSLTKSIVEVGAGYGRVLERILAHNYQGELYAIERSTSLCQYLSKKFPQVTLINEDIRQFQTSKKFGVILWLWIGLSEFSKEEQIPILRHVMQFLEKDGVLILDSITLNTTINSNSYQTLQDAQNVILQTPFGKDYCYLPFEPELLSYIKNLNLKLVERIPYTTLTGRNRTLYVISR